MALVLVKELNGKGNFDTATGHLCPAEPVRDARGKVVRMQRTGGDAWQPEFGKGAALLFKPWQAVVCPSGRPQEDAVLAHVHGIWPSDPPAKRLDFTGRENRDVMLEYLRRHPEVAPKAKAGTAEYTLEMMQLVADFSAHDVPQGRAKIIPMKFDATPEELEAQAATLRAADSAKVQPGRRFGAEGGEASIAQGTALDKVAGERNSAYAKEVYDAR